MRVELRWSGPASVASPYCWNKEIQPLTDLRSLGEVATCERRDHYRLDKLIASHGADADARVIVHELTADCPQRDSAYNVVDDEPLTKRALPTHWPTQPDASAGSERLDAWHFSSATG